MSSYRGMSLSFHIPHSRSNLQDHPPTQPHQVLCSQTGSQLSPAESSLPRNSHGWKRGLLWDERAIVVRLYNAAQLIVGFGTILRLGAGGFFGADISHKSHNASESQLPPSSHHHHGNEHDLVGLNTLSFRLVCWRPTRCVASGNAVYVRLEFVSNRISDRLNAALPTFHGWNMSFTRDVDVLVGATMPGGATRYLIAFLVE